MSCYKGRSKARNPEVSKLSPWKFGPKTGMKVFYRKEPFHKESEYAREDELTLSDHPHTSVQWGKAG
jgi:hypothetical protein